MVVGLVTALVWYHTNAVVIVIAVQANNRLVVWYGTTIPNHMRHIIASSLAHKQSRS